MFIVYGAAGAVASICVGKIIGYVSLTSVSLLNVCLNIGLVAFLLIWEREPNYFVIFAVATLWGICDGSWTTLTSNECLHVCTMRLGAYVMCCLYINVILLTC